MQEFFRFETWSLSDFIGALTLVGGWSAFLVEHFRHRKESRKHTLSSILDPYVQSLQHFNDAKIARATVERLRAAYPEPEKVPEVVERVLELVQESNEQLQSARKEFQRFERMIASYNFHFPGKVYDRLKKCREGLARIGEDLNEQKLEKADIDVAAACDTLKEISDYARGFRLTPHLGWIRRFSERKYEKAKQEKDSKFELSTVEMKEVVKLLNKRLTDQWGKSFVVHPPKKIIEQPEILQADDVIEQLSGDVFEVVFQDGTHAIVGLPQLMVFIYNLIIVIMEGVELHEMFSSSDKKPSEINVSYRFSVQQVMQPETVRALLSKIEFSKEPSDS